MGFFSKLFGREKQTRSVYDAGRTVKGGVNPVNTALKPIATFAPSKSKFKQMDDRKLRDREDEVRRRDDDFMNPMSITSPVSLVNPLNVLSPLSPFNPIHQSNFNSDPEPTRADPTPTYSAPEPTSTYEAPSTQPSYDPSPSYDSGSSSSFDSGGSSGGGDF